MVIFQAPGGNPGYNQFDSLDSAVEFVEQLRNDRDVTNARIFALEEVKFEMRPYFRVELQALTAGAAPQSTAGSPEAAAAATAPTSAPSPAPAAAPSAAPAPPPASPSPSMPPAPQPTAPSAPAPSVPADQGNSGDASQPARRGLFGR